MKKYILFYVCFFFLCCNSKVKKNEIDAPNLAWINESYKERINICKYPEPLMTHFPDSIISTPADIESFENIESGCVYQMLFEYNLPFEAIHALKEKINKDCIDKYSSTEKDLIIIKRNEIRDNAIEYKKRKEQYYPIPYFERKAFSYPEYYPDIKEVYSEYTKCGLSSDFIIYILDSRPGTYQDNLQPLDYMPDGWENGYSKGICFNEKTNIVIYWTIIW